MMIAVEARASEGFGGARPGRKARAISPMVGRLTAQLIAGEKPEEDLHPFRLERFEEGDLRLEGMVIG